ncbi:hypothetical protein [Ascidiaceihabitans sp.]|uniref:hypothetical protein n=1 Tax=Ascidiaceihabitans sp. TaxID=1872644 RepID=UPI0032973336
MSPTYTISDQNPGIEAVAISADYFGVNLITAQETEIAGFNEADSADFASAMPILG